MRSLIAVLSVSLSACSGAGFDVRQRDPFPPPDLGSLSPVERLGYEIYLHDRAAWAATDAALAAGLRDTPARGWITVAQGFGSILVRFAAPCGEGVCSYIDVSTGAATPVVLQRDAAPLPDDQAGAWRARELALNSGFRACTATYNPVVLPTRYQGAPAWRVYLLASSPEPDEIVLAGHHRFTITADGGRVLSQEPLSNSCLVLKAEKSVVAPWVTHVLHPEPIETHVFTSLDYRLPLYVGTERGVYEIRGTRIRVVERR